MTREWSAGLHHSNKFPSHVSETKRVVCGFVAFFFGEDVQLRTTTEGCVGTVSEVHTEGHADSNFMFRRIYRHKIAMLLHHAPNWQALQDARKIEDIILMWTVNFGLNLNETTEEGPRSISVLSLIRDETRLQLVCFLCYRHPSPWSTKYQQHN